MVLVTSQCYVESQLFVWLFNRNVASELNTNKYDSLSFVLNFSIELISPISFSPVKKKETF